MTCIDCFLYAGGGFGFEFETSWASLVYMKIWVEAEFSMSINIDIEAKASSSTDGTNSTSAAADAPTINYWTQERDRNVDITKISPAKFSKTKKVLKKDLIFFVSYILNHARDPFFRHLISHTGLSRSCLLRPTPPHQAVSAPVSSSPSSSPALQCPATDSDTRAAQIASVQVRMNLFLPVFLQLGKLQASSDWSASAGIFMGNKAVQGIATHETSCTMPGCKNLPSNCKPSAW